MTGMAKDMCVVDVEAVRNCHEGWWWWSDVEEAAVNEGVTGVVGGGYCVNVSEGAQGVADVCVFLSLALTALSG